MLIAVPGGIRARAAQPAEAESLEQSSLLRVSREMDRVHRLVRREMESVEAAEPDRAEFLSQTHRSLERLDRRLESWTSRLGREPYQSNFPRFRRVLQSRLRQLERDLELRDAEDRSLYAKTAPGERPVAGFAGLQPIKASPRSPSVPGHVRSSASGASVPANDDCGAATGIGEGHFVGSTATASNDGEASCGTSASSPDVWFRYTAGVTGTVEFNTLGSSFDTVLSLHSGCPGAVSNELDCNDDWGGVQSRLVRDVIAGQEILVRVSGYAGDNGEFLLGIGRQGEIVGTVIDGATGMGLAGVALSVYTDSGSWAGGGTTDAAGAYSVPGLSQGTYYAKAAMPGYIAEVYDDVACPDWCDPTTGTPILVAFGETAVASFALDRASSIEGTVTGTDTGQPLYDVLVEVFDENGYWAGSNWSDVSGVYAVEGLEPGIYYARTASSGRYLSELYDDIPCPGSCDVTSGMPIVLGQSETVVVDFALQLGGSITGVVADESTGQLLTGARMEVHDGFGNWVTNGYSNELGVYEITGLQTDAYFVVAGMWNYVDELYDDIECPGGCNPLAGTPIAVTIGVQTVGVNFILAREGAISGIVLDAASSVPVTDFDVDAWSTSGEWMGWGDGNFWGNYTVGGLPAGTYHATTDNPVGYLDELYDDLPCPLGACDPTAGTPVAVAKAMNTTGVDFALGLGGSLTGTVTDVATGAPIGGRVRVWASSGEQVTDDWIDAGIYMVVGLATGDYFVGTETWSGYADELYDGVFCPPSCDPTAGTPVGVSAGATTTGIDFTLCGAPVLEPHFPPSADADSWVDGCHVQISGVAAPYAPGCPAIDRIHWEWGDGKSVDSPMPASHWYAPDAVLMTVRVSAYDVLGGQPSQVEKQVHLWDCLLPATCGYPEDRELFNLAFDTVEVIQACRSIVVGPGVHLVPPGDVTFRAGEVVEIRNGVFVEADTALSIVNDPGLLP